MGLPKEMKRCMPVCKSGNTTATTPTPGNKPPKGGNTPPNGGKTTPTKATTTGKTTPTKGKTTTGGKTTTAKGKTTTSGKTTTAKGKTTTGGKTTGPSASNAQSIAQALANALNALRAALGTTPSGRALVKRQTDANAKCAEIIKLVEEALEKGKAAIDKATQTTVDTGKTTEAVAALNAIIARNTLKQDIDACPAAQKTILTQRVDDLQTWKDDVVDKVVTALGGATVAVTTATAGKTTNGGNTTPTKVTSTGKTTAASGKTTTGGKATATGGKTTATGGKTISGGKTTTSKTTKDGSQALQKLNNLNN